MDERQRTRVETSGDVESLEEVPLDTDSLEMGTLAERRIRSDIWTRALVDVWICC